MLDATFYSGTSGVAFFLAELFRITGERKFRQTAVGAIEQALCRAESESESDPGTAGLYTGWPGIALAAVRVGIVTGTNSLLRRAKVLTKRCNDANVSERE